VADNVTIVLRLEPKKASGRNWDIGRGADPIICLTDGCYVSEGLARNARYYRGRSVFLPGVRAGKCRNRLSCVFRNVHLKAGKDTVQPIDLDAFEHDFLERRPIQADQTCLLADNNIQCSNGIFTANYAIWAIPEAIAKAAGKQALDYARSKGLHDSKKDYINVFLRDRGIRLPTAVRRFHNSIAETHVSRRRLPSASFITEAFFIAGIENRENFKTGPIYGKIVDVRPIDELAH